MKILCFLVGTVLAAGQSVEPSRKVRLEGKVVSMTGEALSKATLRLVDGDSPENSLSSTTDTGGKFVFEDVPAGRYTLSANKAGFLTQTYGAVLNLKAGAELSSLLIKLTPQGVIAGKVTDQDGDPVAGIQVLSMHYDYVRGHRRLVPVMLSAGRTNDRGDYRITNLMPGRYYLQATDTRAIVATATGERAGRATPESNILTYYPNAPDSASASALDITPGLELRGIDIRLRRAKTYSVKGKAVIAGNGGPAAGSRLTLAPKGADAATIRNYGVAVVLPDGTFEFGNLQAGTFELVSMGVPSANGQTPFRLMSQVEIIISTSDVEGVEPSLAPLGPITGIIAVEDGGLQTVRPRARPLFRLEQSGGPPVGGGAGTQPEEDGSFQIPMVGAVKYWWQVTGLPEQTYVKSVHFGGQDVTRSLVDNTSGAGGTVHIVLSNKAASLTGTAPKGTTLRLWPKVPDLGSYTSGVLGTITDQDGGFRFVGLRPGEYYVAAWEDLEPGLGQSADFLARFQGDASLVGLEENGRATVDVKSIPVERVAAEVARLP